ncbi:hypothetical protein GGI25_002697 [Coemansia spiralis]|uniref:Major facilitator superfamily (MFS) profile domain-containing protein n=1 Tax=Coemansia spiralis TaxID=417178 RepID=A0A9W8KYU7_9FUNG|nr:hypothetical protein GGI25_002697 [Coemansia spiralis]
MNQTFSSSRSSIDGVVGNSHPGFRRRSIVEVLETEVESATTTLPTASTENSSSLISPSSSAKFDSGSLTVSEDLNDRANPEEKPAYSYSPPPEGGYGWVIVACSFLLEFFAEGPLSAFGVFQEYYVNERFKDRTSNATISLVGVLSGSCMACLGVVSGKLCERFGYRIIPLCGIILLSMGYFLASFASEPWHLLLTQGVLCGVGAALTFLPAVVVPAQWFEKRRGLATGTVNMGIGVGGIVWTQFNHLLIKKISVAWTLRLTAIIVLITCTISLMLIKTYQVKTIQQKRVGLNGMKNINLLWYMSASFFTGAASLTPFYYLPGYARDIGISSGGGSLITSIANAASLAGRLIATVSSDYFGPLVILLAAYAFTITGVLFIWTATHNFAGTMAFGIVFGIGYGAIFTQTSAFVARYFGKYSLFITW